MLNDKERQGLMYLIFIIVILISMLWISKCQAFTDEQIADAIYLAEGGHRAEYLYGIRSVKYTDEADARRICLNTIRNQRKRHAINEPNIPYLESLAKRYCPVGCENDTGTNKYWLKNVRYFLER